VIFSESFSYSTIVQRFHSFASIFKLSSISFGFTILNENDMILVTITYLFQAHEHKT